ncbi:MAG: GIY-YIG nuclease family protein [Bacteroidota bacterium]|nr:GIY-YIG nuclease family protein [Bacteroidota bacterium]
MKRAWVYILECSDGSYYTGCTTNIEKRISEHQLGVYNGYTSMRDLIYSMNLRSRRR